MTLLLLLDRNIQHLLMVEHPNKGTIYLELEQDNSVKVAYSHMDDYNFQATLR
jgi:hypothetical protein